MKHIKLFEQQNYSLIDKIESEISEFNKILDTMAKYDESDKSKLVRIEMEGVVRGLNISLNIIKDNE